MARLRKGTVRKATKKSPKAELKHSTPSLEKPEASNPKLKKTQATGTVVPGNAWKKLQVDHELANEGLLSLEVLDLKTFEKEMAAAPTKAHKQTPKAAATPVPSTFAETEVTPVSDQESTDAEADHDELESVDETDAKYEIVLPTLTEAEIQEIADSVPDWLSWDITDIANTGEGIEQVKGKCMTALSSWELDPLLLRNLKLQGWLGPSKIQKLVVPLATVTYDDLSIAAETGSGKTGAFAIPVISHILKAWSVKKPTHELNTIVLAPSHELAKQIQNVFVALSEGTGIKSCTVVGGVSIDKQVRLLSKRPHVVCGTIGRLHALTFGDQNTGITAHPHLQSFKTLKHVILDEADRLLDPGKMDSIRAFFEKYLADNDGKRGNLQILMASATLMMRLGDKKSNKALFATVPLRKARTTYVDLTREERVTTAVVKLPDALKMFKVSCDFKDKFTWLYLVIKAELKWRPTARILVFANSIDFASQIASFLNILSQAALVMPQSKRRLLKEHERQTKKAKTVVRKPHQEKDEKVLLPSEAADPELESPGIALLRKIATAGATIVDGDSETEEPLEDDKETQLTETQSTEVPQPRFLLAEGKSLAVRPMHSRMNQKRRYTVFEKFVEEEGPTHRVMVSSDIAARGLDFPAVDVVIHMQVPRNGETLVHRCGRTARGLHAKEGRTLFLCSTNDNETDSYETVFKRVGRDFQEVPALNAQPPQILRSGRKIVSQAQMIEREDRRNEKNHRIQSWWKRASELADVVDEHAAAAPEDAAAVAQATLQYKTQDLESLQNAIRVDALLPIDDLVH